MTVADPYAAVEGALDLDARELVRERAGRLNPSLSGSAVSDILLAVLDAAPGRWRTTIYWTEHGAVLAGELGPDGENVVASAMVAVGLLLDLPGVFSEDAEKKDKAIVLTRRLAQAAYSNETHAVTIP